MSPKKVNPKDSDKKKDNDKKKAEKKKDEKKQGAIKLSQETDSSNSSDSPSNSDNDQATKILGAFFVIAGLVLIAGLVVIYVLSKLPYRTDPNMPIPTLEELDEYTNEDSVDISGEVVPGENVILFIDDEMTDQKIKADDDGEFTFEDVALEDEEEYKFQAASVRGFVLKKRSEKSNTVAVNFDDTDPSSEVKFEDYPEETDSEKINLKGEAEKDTSIILKQDETEFETETDEDGTFEFKDVELEEGENNFEVIVEDRAGNKATSSTELKVKKLAGNGQADGDLNGPGATDDRTDANGKLPESSGELDQIREILAQNDIMFTLGILAVLVFMASSFGVYVYNFKRNQ